MKKKLFILLLLPCSLFAQRNIIGFTPDWVKTMPHDTISLKIPTIKKTAGQQPKETFFINDTPNHKIFPPVVLSGPSLLFINGEMRDESSASFLNKFSSKDTSVKNILVKRNELTPAFSIKRYGEKAENGAIELTLKNAQTVLFYSLLNTFHLPDEDKNLPVFLVDYNHKKVLYPNRFYVSPDMAGWCTVKVVDGMQGKEIDIKVNNYFGGQVRIDMLNGKWTDEASLFCINPVLATGITWIYKDSILKKAAEPFIKQDDLWRKAGPSFADHFFMGYNVTTKDKKLLLTLDEIFRLFHIDKQYRQWPLILKDYGAIRYPGLFLATQDQIDSVTVNKEMKYVAIKSKYPFPPLSYRLFGDEDTLLINGVKTIPQRIIEIQKGLPPGKICVISRRSLLRQYVKK